MSDISFIFELYEENKNTANYLRTIYKVTIVITLVDINEKH